MSITTAQQRRARAWGYGLSVIILTFAALLSAPVQAERIKDLASIEGVRSNQLIGYGLVVGLDGTGDQTTQAPFTVQSLRAMLGQLGVEMPANVNPQLKNVAAVAIHADLPPFAKIGQGIDITVSSIGNAGSLRGGSLLMTALRGADGQVYAIAQGNVVVGGLGVSGKDGSRVSINVPSAGRIPNGATVERTVESSFASAPQLRLNLHTPDFTTAARMAEAINTALGGDFADAQDAVTVSVTAPADQRQRVAFMAALETLELTPGEAAARVVINSRTGTVVIGNHVQVRPAAVSHGALAVTITERAQISQPQPFSDGQTVAVPQSSIEVSQAGEGRMFKFEAGVSLDDIVRAVNQVGAAPGDLVAILEALKQAGALRAELVVI
ncbi:flagellar basal body P-ring protein FlgI [Sinimarinibacterium sp. NLF-5-8]|uniref:flagellar basal body P-ring protein FlgI n=1 Tax=Sinimarinibacterium sp. NLF-5-8 TaxID=2698684 RepID=UPI00137BDB73|nr:flagellar basal body P-ring protein FlgI [Sinimarinibacterium sp. NLF-5-8]QHS10011.1 flagellar basal body P-ring protein FlgI [Sinimarinibacterium sp. NLF-5-8]